MPESSVDPVVMAAATVLRLQTIVSREIAASQAAVVTVGALRAGTKDNVIPDEAVTAPRALGRARTRARDAVEAIGVLAAGVCTGHPMVCMPPRRDHR
jgi:hippurate hydrolase